VRALRVAVLPVALALGLFAEWAALRRGPFQEVASAADIRLAVADLVVGLVFVGGGLVAWIWRPESGTGPLLILVGFTWFLGTFAGSGQARYATFGAALVTLHRGPLVHALLSYPNGRLERRTEQVAVAVAYALSAYAGIGATPAVGIVLAAIVLAVGARRFFETVGPLRRARAVAAAASGAFAAVLFFSALTRLGGAGTSLDRAVLWAYMVVLAGIALGLTLDLRFAPWLRATVTGLVVDLGEAANAGTLRERLASALGDRSLVLGFRLPDSGSYVDEGGREVELPEEDGERRVTIVRHDGEPIAALVHNAEVLASPDLLDSVAAAARIAVANARLHVEVLRQVDELEASRRRLVEAGDAERRRLERELREGAQRRLDRAEVLLCDAAGGADGGVATMLIETQTRLEQTRSELREFARGIHPRALTAGGLSAALPELVERAAVPVELHVAETRYPEPVEAAVYFVCSEALANLGKYAQASAAALEVSEQGGSLVLTVSDDGKGGASTEKGSGLRGLADRVEALGGRLVVTSPPGHGTRLVAKVPLA
jgi:signal transduction histidine kinase